MSGETPGSLWSEPQSADFAHRPIKAMDEAFYPRHSDFRVVRAYRGGMGEVFICEAEPEAEKEKYRFALKTFQKRFFLIFMSVRRFCRKRLPGQGSRGAFTSCQRLS